MVPSVLPVSHVIVIVIITWEKKWEDRPDNFFTTYFTDAVGFRHEKKI